LSRCCPRSGHAEARQWPRRGQVEPVEPGGWGVGGWGGGVLSYIRKKKYNNRPTACNKSPSWGKPQQSGSTGSTWTLPGLCLDSAWTLRGQHGDNGPNGRWGGGMVGWWGGARGGAWRAPRGALGLVDGQLGVGAAHGPRPAPLPAISPPVCLARAFASGTGWANENPQGGGPWGWGGASAAPQAAVFSRYDLGEPVILFDGPA